ncbi:MAG: relaxase/mobilization nuclease domain-containing protein [Coriobacteriaceae bacterium]|uniref:relaxase/mobilization nuclease domain-containing protein n=1 Tax=Tractidigestivibacter sp. TaxID=2847320 RepID=UPI002A7F1347|nr:relaxase/mobilization nuclease domain-containing protein [Tractidigestivibacter sp.]MCI6547851.1 relaxase/mobilization nuclease domain-containing protein [Coriobacteriaceae bacterium]MCI6844655.1 relaxase/mobilization nuclease domain-containing protein [Coriobacteriaceae bacterium]MDD7584529.1 relaxase/mobilization nuclease domain-containing protein [Coriobacteriaceae bacterium]MDY4535585.1 relaxase/mobilization nuclease domain-containing protein [Tractidigestivibacter sp.]
MAILKVMPRKGTTRAIRAYLERGGRALACDTNLCEPGQDWAGEMQRAVDGYEAATGRQGGRSYYHVVISPDPGDACDLATTRELATRWVQARYPDSGWAIEYHDDNGIVHAHVVICAVLATGGKVHVTREGLRGDMDALQGICREMGLAEVPQEARRPRRAEDGYVVRGADEGRDRSERWSRQRAEQRAVRAARVARGESAGRRRVGPGGAGWSWMDDIRREVDACVARTGTWREFVAAMRADGYGVRVTHRRGAGVGVTLEHPRGYKVKGYKLDRRGGAYTLHGIVERLSPNLADGKTYEGWVPAGGHREGEAFESRLVERARRRSRIDMQDVADAYAWVTGHGVASAEEARAVVRGTEQELADAKADLESAEAIARKAAAAGPGEARSGMAGRLVAAARERVDGLEAEAVAARRAADVIGRSGMGYPDEAPSKADAISGPRPVYITAENAADAGRILEEYQRSREAELRHEDWVRHHRPREAVIAIVARARVPEGAHGEPREDREDREKRTERGRGERR